MRNVGQNLKPCMTISQKVLSSAQRSLGKSNKYFLNLERCNSSKIHLKKPIENDTDINDASVILKHIKHFHIDLYSTRSCQTELDCLKYLSTVNMPTLSRNESKSCEGKLYLNEIYDALKSMPSNRSPRNDGFSK